MQSAFISYARRTNLDEAKALHQALGAEVAFLDSQDIEGGQEFPEVIAKALLGATVIVVFADEAYFSRWYCLRELSLALAPYETLLRKGEADEGSLAGCLAHIVVALPQEGATRALELLPPHLTVTQWPRASDTDLLAEFVAERLRVCTENLQQQFSRVGVPSDVELSLTGGARVPTPTSLVGTKMFPLQIPPSLQEGFVGRAEQLWLIDYLLRIRRGENSCAALTGALEGGGGFGKTRLALEYLHRFGRVHYKGGLFWLDADVAATRMEEQHHGILSALLPATPGIKAFREDGRDAYRELEAAFHAVPPDEQVLVVVDNIPETTGAEPPDPLTKWCPALGKLTVLATSRRRLSLNPTVLPVEIAELSSLEGRALLVRGLDPRSLNEDEWQKVADWVGCLPLALELLNRALVASVTTGRELLDASNRADGQTSGLDGVMSALEGKVPAGTLRGVTEALKVSYDKLPEECQVAARLLAQLGHEPIPEALLREIVPPESLATVRSTLVERSFIQRVDDPDGIMLGRIHRVLADFLRTQSTSVESEGQEIARCVLTVMDSDACRDPSAWSLLKACDPHAGVLVDRLLDNGSSVETAVDLCLRRTELMLGLGLLEESKSRGFLALELARESLGPADDRALSAMNNLASALYLMGDLEEALDYQQSILEVRTSRFGKVHPFTLGTMTNVASILDSQGNYDQALELHKKASEGRRLLHGEEDPLTLLSVGNLASTLCSLGRYGEARAVLEDVVARHKKVLGPKHSDTLTSINNLAQALYHLGDRDGARVLQEGILEARKEVLGESHLSTIQSKISLAETLEGLGRLEGASKLAADAVRSAEQELGREHPTTTCAISAHAVILYARGDRQQAGKLEAEVLAVRRRRLGDDHPATLRSAANMAMIRDEEGEFDAACSILEELLRLQLEKRGEAHPDTVSVMGSLASALHDQGKLSRASQLYERVILQQERVLPADHPELLQAKGNLATVLDAQGHYKRGFTLAQEVLDAQQRTLGRDHLHVLTSMHNIAGRLLARGEIGEAKRMFGEAHAGFIRALGSDHPKTLDCMKGLASVAYAEGDTVQSQRLEEEGMGLCEKLLGEEHLTTLEWSSDLGLSLAANGYLERAQALQVKVLRVRRQRKGNEHPQTLLAISNLGTTYHAKGDFESARRMHEEALEGRRDLLGPEHEDTLVSLNNLATTISKQGQTTRARELLEEAVNTSLRVLGSAHPRTLAAMHNLSWMLHDEGRFEPARRICAGALQGYERVLGVKHPHTINVKRDYEHMVRLQGDDHAG